MKRIFAMMLLICLLTMLPVTAAAVQEDMSFAFELTVDGKDSREVAQGDIITVVVKLKREDSSEGFPMYAMQNEIRYDSQFFELVEGSVILNQGIASADIAMVDRYRELYMNYLSMSGGTQWDPDTFVGSFQLRVIAESGVTTISSQDYLVSYADGSGTYPCTANDLTIVMSTDCTVQFVTSGGNEIPNQTVQFGEKAIRPEDPSREGYSFTGWYRDIHLTEEWDFDTDTVQGNLTLYAKWIAEEPADTAQDTENRNSLWWIGLILLPILLYLLWKKKQTGNKKS